MMRQARGAARQTAPTLPAAAHEPSLTERLELARDCMLIARFAGGTGRDVALAKREMARARSEVTAVSRALEQARVRSMLLDGEARQKILKLLALSRRIADELRAASTKLSRLNR